MKLESSRQIFEKYSNMKFHKNPSSECGQTDRHSFRHDTTNCRFSQFCERV